MSKDQSLELEDLEECPRKLLTAWRNLDIKGFIQCLNEGCDVNHQYKEEYYQPILGVIARANHQNGKAFAEAVVTRVIDIDKQFMSGKCAIHHAVEGGNVPVLEALLAANVKINSSDQSGCTALHIAVMQNWNKNLHYQQCLQLLTDHSDINLNIVNRKGLTPIHLAANKKNREAVVMLLEKGSLLDLDSSKNMGITPRGAILQWFPNLESELPIPIRIEVVKMDGSKLCNLLYRNEEERFCTAFEKEMQDKSQKELLTFNDGKNTLLQYACLLKLTNAVKTLVKYKADPCYSTNFNSEKPTEMAAKNGFTEILQVLLEAVENLPLQNDESLHLACKYSKNMCVELLLKKNCIDINSQDKLGNTPLHYAVVYGNDEIVAALLSYGCYLAVENRQNETPLPKVPYHVLKKFLDDKITHFTPKDDNQIETFKFDFSFLKPPNGDHSEPSEKDQLKGDNQVSKKMEQETKPLLIMSQSPDLRTLLAHPVLTSFTLLKWQRIQIFFYVNFIFYLTLCLFLTGYIIFAYQEPQHFEVKPENAIITNPDKIDYHDKSNFTEIKPQKQLNSDTLIYTYITSIVRIIILILLSLLFLREILQIIIKPKSYPKNYENYLELLLLFLGLFIVINNCSSVSNNNSYLTYLCPQFSALLILISWFELFLLLGKHPLFSVQIEMFKKVSKSFLLFLSWYILLIISFALCFYVLFRGCDEKCSVNNSFLNPLQSIFKTLVMLTGEFEATDIPFVSYIGVSHVIFIAFVFLMAIVLLNLLNGLAVADTREIKDAAYYYSCIARLELISFIEDILLSGDKSKIRDIYIKCSLFNYFTNRIVFFKSFLPDGKIVIDVDKLSIDCSEKESQNKSKYYIDKETVRAAQGISYKKRLVETKSKDGDSVGFHVETCLKKIDELGEKILNFEKRFEAIEHSNKQIEELLIRNIAIVSLNHANNEDR